MAKKQNKLRTVYFDVEQVPHPEFIWQPYAGFKVDKSLLLSVCCWDPNNDSSPTLYMLSRKELKDYVACSDIVNKWERINERNKIDKGLTELVMNHLNEKSDVIFTWYGARHDMKYMNGKAMYHRLHPCTHTKHIDVYDTAKSKMSVSSNRLGNIARFLGVSPKGDISPDKWDRTRNGHYPSLLEIGKYNIQDVVTLKEVTDKLQPLIRNHPHFRILDKQADHISPAERRKYLADFCKMCGGTNIIHNGTQLTDKGRAQKYWCNACADAKGSGSYVW